MAVPAEAQNLDQVKPGSRFKVRFLEEVAVSVGREGVASAGAGSAMQLAPKGGTPGGTMAQTVQVTGVVEKVDPAARQITVKGPQGNSRSLSVAKDVQLEALKPGDTITLAHTQALAMEMIPTEEPMREPLWTP
jgi:Cu/Ag efflux protein CusF